MGVWICFLFYKFCIFTFLPFLFYFFAPAAQFSCGFWALAHSSFNIFQKFQRIIKAGLNALLKRYDTCMYAKKTKLGPKRPFSAKTQKNTIFLLFFDWGQPNSNLVFIFILGRSSLILSKIGPKIKKNWGFFAVDPIWRKFDWNFSHILIFLQFFQNVDFKAPIQLY